MFTTDVAIVPSMQGVTMVGESSLGCSLYHKYVHTFKATIHTQMCSYIQRRIQEFKKGGSFKSARARG